MTRRRLLCGLLFASAVLVCVVGWRAIYAPGHVRAYERVRLGMTLAEVEAAIGAPPGWYAEPKLGGITSGPFGEYIRESGVPSKSLLNPQYRESAGITVEQWIWDDYWIEVALDKDGKAVGYYLLESSGPRFRSSFLARLRAFIGL
jgi:hypothetical protein